jgi:hypothetical protein
VSERPRAEYALASGLFLRGLGVVYAIAFASLAVQALGLYGARGILPVTDLLDLARDRMGGAAPLEMPTLFWIDASDAALLWVAWAGVASGIALACGVAPRLCAALCWALYLSWAQVGRVFLGFQWDALLLETGLLAIWLAPSGWRVPLAHTPEPPAAPLWLLRWLVFRLFFLSGLVKLASGDPAWRDLSAMAFHQWTQPLPNPLSPFVHALPMGAHRLATLATFAVELALPLLVFTPARIRRFAALGFLLLLAGINATGNYGFFGLLSAVLCIPLVDDAVWRKLEGAFGASPRRSPPARYAGRVRRTLAIAATVLVLVVTTGHALRRFGIPLPGAWTALLGLAEPLSSFHAYGLFAVMTKDRLEIEIEGTLDGETWRAYEFRWKPDRADEAPPFVPFHMPRLDWQMWFAALADCATTPWFVAFQARLLEASPEVLALLARDPFDGAPPRQVRSTIDRARFARPGDLAARLRPATRDRLPDWWIRDPLGPYCPTLELDEGRLRVAR